MRLVSVTKTFDRRHSLAGSTCSGYYAGSNCFAVKQHGTSAALRQPATKLRAIQFNIVSQHFQQGRAVLYIYVDSLSIEIELDAGCLLN